ncbi:uncharacterized protein LOC110629969 isoform X2 [Manihot esculenta]|uniref:uncharacterized protein LOC110629969 isoform X2 n=1 Tax=Manihot esculenta TaxID=3983 RepID=UPI000B5D177C|nr:uncharacterized protein LOC110629969 isoform X2 [Manihot esculenta]
MESELVDKAIQKLNKESSPDTLQEDRDTDKLLLSRLLSELESLKSGRKVEKSEASAEQKDPLVGEAELKNEKATRVENSSSQIGAEEIMKELKKNWKMGRIRLRAEKMMGSLER